MDAIKEGLLASAKAAESAARIGERLFCQNTQSVMNFKSQICTTREQSAFLTALGLKKETADMYYSNFIICAKPYYKVVEFMNGCVPEDIFPAWSLHRLIELIDEPEHIARWIGVQIANDYDYTVGCIEWLIKEGYFNKEYLED